MANALHVQKLIDNNKRALVKLVWLSDGTAEANTVMIDAASLGFAMNVNNMIMGAATDRKSNYRTTIKHIFGQAKSGGYVKLGWQGDNNVPIVAFTTGVFDYKFDTDGAVAVIPPASQANASGNIVFSTAAAAANDMFTLFIDIKKDARDYDQGQTAMPGDFNRGPRGLV
jgi:hypothetical protein